MKRILAFLPPALLEELRRRLKERGLPEPSVSPADEAESPGPKVADLVVRVWKADRKGEG